MAGALHNPVSAPFGSSFDSLERRTLIHQDGRYPQVIHIQAVVVLSIGNGGLKSFLDNDRCLLRTESQNIKGILNRLAAYLISDKTCFLSREASALVLGCYFHFDSPHNQRLAFLSAA